MLSSNRPLNFIKKLLIKEIPKREELYQTFTYYIPAPPSRESGYQEKELDRLTYTLASLGFKITSVKTQAHHQQTHSGMWVFLQLKAMTKKAKKIKIFEGLNSSEGKTEAIKDIHPVYHDLP